MEMSSTYGFIGMEGKWKNVTSVFYLVMKKHPFHAIITEIGVPSPAGTAETG
jgi:hypothetical protein